MNKKELKETMEELNYHKDHCTGGGADVVCIENCISDENDPDYYKLHYKCEVCNAEWYE